MSLLFMSVPPAQGSEICFQADLGSPISVRNLVRQVTIQITGQVNDQIAGQDGGEDGTLGAKVIIVTVIILFSLLIIYLRLSLFHDKAL